MSDFSAPRSRYREYGLAVLPRWLSESRQMKERVVEIVKAQGQDRDQCISGAGVGSVDRRIADRVLHGWRAAAFLPELVYLQAAIRVVAEQVTGAPHLLNLSPFERSGVTVRHMVGGGEHGWHVESNSVTGLLYLTDHALDDGGGALEYCRCQRAPSVRPLEDMLERSVEFWPKSGDLAILRGHDLWHRVTALPEGVERAVIVFNFYHSDEISRPVDLDFQHYGAER